MLSDANLGPIRLRKDEFIASYDNELLYFDKCYLYAKNLEQSKYEYLISKEVGYDTLEVSNDEIQSVSEMNGGNQKLVIFDDFVCEKNQ